MDSQVNKHICGVCNDEFLTEPEYTGHVCPTTGHNPSQAEHLVKSTTPDFLEVQRGALQNGLVTLEDQGQDTTAQQSAIDQHVSENNLEA